MGSNKVKMACRCDEYRDMLYSVVDELDLSASAIEKHGPLGTPVADLVRLVLDEKDLIISALKAGMKIITKPRVVQQKTKAATPLKGGDGL